MHAHIYWIIGNCSRVEWKGSVCVGGCSSLDSLQTGVSSAASYVSTSSQGGCSQVISQEENNRRAQVSAVGIDEWKNMGVLCSSSWKESFPSINLYVFINLFWGPQPHARVLGRKITHAACCQERKKLATGLGLGRVQWRMNLHSSHKNSLGISGGRES